MTTSLPKICAVALVLAAGSTDGRILTSQIGCNHGRFNSMVSPRLTTGLRPPAGHLVMNPLLRDPWGDRRDLWHDPWGWGHPLSPGERWASSWGLSPSLGSSLLGRCRCGKETPGEHKMLQLQERNVLDHRGHHQDTENRREAEREGGSNQREQKECQGKSNERTVRKQSQRDRERMRKEAELRRVEEARRSQDGVNEQLRRQDEGREMRQRQDEEKEMRRRQDEEREMRRRQDEVMRQRQDEVKEMRRRQDKVMRQRQDDEKEMRQRQDAEKEMRQRQDEEMRRRQHEKEMRRRQDEEKEMRQRQDEEEMRRRQHEKEVRRRQDEEKEMRQRQNEEEMRRRQHEKEMGRRQDEEKEMWQRQDEEEMRRRQHEVKERLRQQDEEREMRRRQGEERQGRNQRQPRVEVAVLTVPGYAPEDISVRTSGGRLLVSGRHVCDCSEQCAEREFQRGFPVPAGVDPAGLRAQLTADGRLTVTGSRGRLSLQSTDGGAAAAATVVTVEGDGSFPPRSSSPDPSCGGRRRGFNLKKMNKRTGEILEDYKVLDEERTFEDEVDEDGVTMEVED